jgi:hypothetical protein
VAKWRRPFHTSANKNPRQTRPGVFTWYLEADRTSRSGSRAMSDYACWQTSRSRTWPRSRSRRGDRRTGRSRRNDRGGSGRDGSAHGSNAHDGNGHGRSHGRNRRPVPCRSSGPFGPRRTTAHSRSSGPWRRSSEQRRSSRGDHRTIRSHGRNGRGSRDGSDHGNDCGRSRCRSHRPTRSRSRSRRR